MTKPKMAQAVKEVVRGHALYRTFLERNDISFRDAATAVGAKHPAAWQWAHEKTIPEDIYRDRIATYTRGAVPSESWLRKDEKKPFVVQPFKSSGTEG